MIPRPIQSRMILPKLSFIFLFLGPTGLEGLKEGLDKSYEYYDGVSIDKISKTERKNQTSKAVRKIKVKDKSYVRFQEEGEY